jgi:hypothetical protein
MFEHIATLLPHNAKESVSVYYARNVVLRLTHPLTMINAGLQETIEKVEERQKLVQKFRGDETELRKILNKKITLKRWEMKREEREWCRRCATEQHYKGEDRLQFIEADPTAMDTDPFVLCLVAHWFEIGAGKMCPKCGPDTNRVNTKRTFYHLTEEKEQEDETVASEMKEKLSKHLFWICEETYEALWDKRY